MSTAKESSSRRLGSWRLKYSLRRLLIVVTLLTLPFAYLGYEARRVRDQRRAVEIILDAGGKVYYDYQCTKRDGLLEIIETASKQNGKQGLADGKSIQQWLFGRDFGSHVVMVDFEYGRHVSKAALQEIIRLEGLQELSVSGPNLTDAFVESISDISTLEVLGLESGAYSADAVGNLARLPRLKVLSLVYTDIGDAGIAKLHEIKTLEELDICVTGASEGGVARLQAALPNLDIWYGN